MNEILAAIGILLQRIAPSAGAALSRWLDTLLPTVQEQLATESAKIATGVRLAHIGDPNWTLDEIQGEIEESIRMLTINLTGSEPPHPAIVPAIAAAVVIATVPKS